MSEGSPFSQSLALARGRDPLGCAPTVAGDGGAPWDLPVDTELQVPLARGHPGIALTAAPHPAMRQARAPDFALWPRLLKGLSVFHRHPEATPGPPLEP